uniref:Uncharacterized protein n=1 Tax=Otus sunia TaxID=257818 RepID=A0A8C8BQ44_9STRI
MLRKDLLPLPQKGLPAKHVLPYCPSIPQECLCAVKPGTCPTGSLSGLCSGAGRAPQCLLVSWLTGISGLSARRTWPQSCSIGRADTGPLPHHVGQQELPAAPAMLMPQQQTSPPLAP